MARARRASDDVYNARRRLRRAAAKAERTGEQERASQLRRLAEETYIGRGVAASVERAASAALAALRQIPRAREPRRDEQKARERDRGLVSALRSVARSVSPRGAAKRLTRAFLDRDNAIFSREINLASMDLPSSIDRRDLSGKSQARIFWMSTRKLWMGVPPEQRYDAIMRALGTDSLRLAFDRVLRYNEAAVAMAESAEREVRDTLADMGDERGDEPVSVDYPPEFMYFVKDYSAVVNRMR